MFGRTPIDVGNADVENVAISLSEGFDLQIRMTIEGRSRRSDEPQLVVNLRPVFTATPFPTVERNGDDVITMHHLMLGDYSVAVLSLRNQLNQNGSLVNGTLYLKSAQYGGADVLYDGTAYRRSTVRFAGYYDGRRRGIAFRRSAGRPKEAGIWRNGRSRT
jgi:hypothetical protein